MKRYRSSPPKAQRPRMNDDWTEFYTINKSIDVYEPDNHWTQIPILHPETGRPIEAYTGPDPIGFVWFEEVE